MRHSNRLTSLTSHVVFVVVGLAGASTTLVNHLDEAWVRYGVIPLLILFLCGGTLGWMWIQKTQRFWTIYYPLMAGLGSVIIFVATYVAGGGLAAAIIVLPLVMHGAVLPGRARLLFLSLISAGLFIGVLIAPTQIDSWLAFAAALSGVLAFDFVGRVIVSEEQTHEQLARYARDVEELSIMRERNRLAREIHDNLGHYLTAINMQAQAAQAVLSIDPQQANEALTHIQGLAREGLQEVRQSIAAVRARPMEHRSLHEAIEILVIDTQSRGLAVDFQITGKPSPRAAEVEMTIYRIVQEALTNIHKHAQAQHVTIQMHYGETPPSIRLQVCDDGMGTENTEGGFGLLGLRERVRLLGGTIQIRTAPGKGFCIEVEIAK